MFYKKISFKKYGFQKEANFEIIVPTLLDVNNPKLPCMVVIPGGGYTWCSRREADPIATRFLGMGYAVAILWYSVTNYQENAPALFPEPQLEALAVLSYLNKHANKLNIDKKQISVVGFSAGAHLAGTAGYLYNNQEFLLKIGVRKICKPKSIGLCYPVITMGEKTHLGSKNNLIGSNQSLVDFMSIEKNVTKDYPATFIWTTDDDACVPSDNTRMMIEALNKAKVKCWSHIYPHGPHGLATADLQTNCKENCDSEIAQWFEQYDAFIKSI